MKEGLGSGSNSCNNSGTVDCTSIYESSAGMILDFRLGLGQLKWKDHFKCKHLKKLESWMILGKSF